MIEQQLSIKHYIALAIVLLVVAIASIQPLEFEAYLLHQAGTVLMLIALIVTMKKIGIMQDFPNRAKRLAEIELAKAELGSANAQTEILRIELRQKVASVWLRCTLTGFC